MEKMHNNIRHAEHGDVPPLIDENCHTLVLGSMLSPRSAAERFYYAHPQNRFWRVISAVFGEDLPSSNEAKSALALSNCVALWDVLSSCDIVGASDGTIKNVRYNDIAGLIALYPRITRVFTTGKKAFELLQKYNETAKVEIISKAECLPSTSPQNFRMTADALVKAYSVIKSAR